MFLRVSQLSGSLLGLMEDKHLYLFHRPVWPQGTHLKVVPCNLRPDWSELQDWSRLVFNRFRMIPCEWLWHHWGTGCGWVCPAPWMMSKSSTYFLLILWESETISHKCVFYYSRRGVCKRSCQMGVPWFCRSTPEHLLLTCTCEVTSGPNESWTDSLSGQWWNEVRENGFEDFICLKHCQIYKRTWIINEWIHSQHLIVNYNIYNE